MKKILFILVTITLFSCEKKNSVFTDGEWIDRSVIYLKNESIVFSRRIQFLENGDIYENKYHLYAKYRIKGNKFQFLNHDTVSAVYDIVKATNDEIKLEANFNVKVNKKDTVINRKLHFTKTESTGKKPYDPILYNLAKKYDIGKLDTLGTGDIFINFDTQYYDEKIGDFVIDNPYQTEPKIKGIIDKSIGSLPKEEKTDQYSSFSHGMYNYYKWETLDYILKMENSFKTNYRNQTYLNVKLWITEK